MVHLADKQHPQKEFILDHNQEFVQFVDQTQDRHSASIMVLLYDRQDKKPVVRIFRYFAPFEKKDFSAEANWVIEEHVKISENASKWIREVLFQKNWKEQLRAGFRKKFDLLEEDLVSNKLKHPKKVLAV